MPLVSTDHAKPASLGPFVWVEVAFWTMLAMLGAVVAILAAEVAAPDWVEANRPTFYAARALVCLLLGVAAGSSAFARLRQEGHLGGGSALKLAVWMGTGLALGDWLGSVLPPILGMTARRPYASLPVVITCVVAGVGAWLAITRSGLTPPTPPVPVGPQPGTRPPLAGAELALVQQGFALLDRIDRELSRLSSPGVHASALTKESADHMFALLLEYSNLCAHVPKGHPVLMPMLDSGLAYPIAIRLRFAARGAHEAVGGMPGAVEYAKLIADRYRSPTNNIGQVADVVWREARAQRNKAAGAAGLPDNH